jgi:hypothetical protein
MSPMALYYYYITKELDIQISKQKLEGNYALTGHYDDNKDIVEFHVDIQIIWWNHFFIQTLQIFWPDAPPNVNKMVYCCNTKKFQSLSITLEYESLDICTMQSTPTTEAPTRSSFTHIEPF